MKSLGDKVVRGMGAGIPVNQRMAGAQDPARAAALAASTNSVTEAEEEVLEIEGLERKLDIIQDAIKEGFETPFSIEDLKSNSDLLLKVFTEFEEWEKSKIDEELEFEYNIPADDPLYDPIRDTSRRKRIEKNLEPLDFESMIFKGYCSQEIPIRPNFSIVFRTLNTNQSLWIESMTLDLQEKSVQYGRHWMSLVQLAVCLDKINTKEISPVISKFTKQSQEDDFRKALEARMEFVGQLPQVLTDDLIIQYAWFSARVRKLMSGDVVEKLGNS